MSFGCWGLSQKVNKINLIRWHYHPSTRLRDDFCELPTMKRDETNRAGMYGWLIGLGLSASVSLYLFDEKFDTLP